MPLLVPAVRFPRFGTSRAAHIFSILALSFLASSAFAEAYVIPIWARALEGSDGSWWTQATVINPHSFPVTIQVTGVFPLRTTDCMTCTGDVGPMTVQPHGAITVEPPAGEAGRRLVAGAFELEATAEVHIHLVAYRPGANELRQRLDVARSWLLPGTRAVSSVERSGRVEARINVFLVNPGDTALEVSTWAGNRNENEVRSIVPARSSSVVTLPRLLCGGAPCASLPDYPPRPLVVYVEANGVFLASVSSLSTGWAVFSVADEALIAGN